MPTLSHKRLIDVLPRRGFEVALAWVLTWAAATFFTEMALDQRQHWGVMVGAGVALGALYAVVSGWVALRTLRRTVILDKTAKWTLTFWSTLWSQGTILGFLLGGQISIVQLLGELTRVGLIGWKGWVMVLGVQAAVMLFLFSDIASIWEQRPGAEDVGQAVGEAPGSSN